jgi:hypothetical protein
MRKYSELKSFVLKMRKMGFERVREYDHWRHTTTEGDFRLDVNLSTHQLLETRVPLEEYLATAVGPGIRLKDLEIKGPPGTKIYLSLEGEGAKAVCRKCEFPLGNVFESELSHCPGCGREMKEDD